MQLHEAVAQYEIPQDRDYHIVRRSGSYRVPSIQGLILDLYKETIDNLTGDIESGTDTFREHLASPVCNPLRLDLLPGPTVTDVQYNKFMPSFRDQRYMLYTIRPHHDFEYDTNHFRLGYEDNYDAMTSKTLRDMVAVDYLCFNRALQQSGIDLSSKFLGYKPMVRKVVDELLETGNTLHDCPEKPKVPILFYDLINLVTTRVGVDRHDVIEEIRNA